MKVSSLLLCFLIPALGQAQILFQKTLGDQACTEEAISLAIRNDTSLFLSAQQVCGGTSSIPLLYTLNQNGDSLSKTPNPSFNGSIIKHKNDIYSFLGDETFPVNNDSIHLFRVKADSGIHWQEAYFKGSCNNTATDQFALSNDRTFYTGIYSFTDCSSPVYNSFYRIIDQHGKEVWTNFVKGAQNDQIHAAKQTADNGYVLAGWTDSRGAGLADYLLVKTNNSGDTLWTKTYGNGKANKCYGVAVAPDSGFYMLGYTDSVQLIKTDQQGNKEWTQTFGKACGGNDFSIKTSLDQGYSLFTLEEIDGQCHSVLYKIQPDGSVFWRKEFGKGQLRTYQELNDTSYVLAGYLYDTTTFQSDILITAFDSTTYTTQETGVHSSNSSFPGKNELTIQPHPVSASARVGIQGEDQKISTLIIYSLKGKQLRHIEANGTKNITIQKNDLSPGLYIISLQSTKGKTFFNQVVFR